MFRLHGVRKNAKYLSFMKPYASDIDSLVRTQFDTSTSTSELVEKMVYDSMIHAFGDRGITKSDCVIFAGKADKGDYQVN